MRTMKIIRWIAVIPGAVICAIVGNWIVGYIVNFWQDDDWGWHWLQVIHEYLLIAMQSFWEPLIFIVSGMFIAPSYKREAGFFLFGGTVMIALGILALAISKEYFFTVRNYVFYICHFAGCAASFLFLPSNDAEFKKNWKE